MSENLRGVPVKGFAEKSREAAVEGIVLLKNQDNVLPFSTEDKISVFGRPQLEYYRSGTGSGGAVQNRKYYKYYRWFQRNNNLN